MIINHGVSKDSQARLFAFTHGCDVDRRLCTQELAAQRAWLNALARGHYLAPAEVADLSKALEEARLAMEQGRFEWRVEDEDIHMNLERFLTERCGEAGRKLHLGRSRNDLIATTLRLVTHDLSKSVAGLIVPVVSTIARQASRWMPVLVPGLTHGQAGQPVRLGHIFAAHGHALRRDTEHLLRVAHDALEECPLGAGAFAGTHLSLDLEALARELGFRRPLIHSYDAVGNRDTILWLLSALATLSVHVSRLCLEVIYLCSTAVGILQLPKDYSTGSSMMPNKRNPDVFELVRARMARVMAASFEGQSIVREVLPSYGTDLHELKRTLFRATDECLACLDILEPSLAGLRPDPLAATGLLAKGHLLATDIANHLALKMPFRQAYQMTADWVAEADTANVPIHVIAHRKTNHGFDALQSVESRSQHGGTALSSASASVEELQEWASSLNG
jgi:argininosuccinate lyase